MPILGPSTNLIEEVNPYNRDPGNLPIQIPSDPFADYHPTFYHKPEDINSGQPYHSGNMPSQQEVINEYGLNDAYSTGAPFVEEWSPQQQAVENSLNGGFSLSEYMADHPGASYEQIMQEASKYSDEYAEVYLNYLTEKGELEKANQWTASREDTAYQRLVSDLKAAGLNPAMMYGSSASPQASASQGYIKMTEGANTRQINGYSRVKQLLLNYMSYELKKALGITDSVFKGIDSIAGILKIFL